MTAREAQLEAALRVNAALCVQAERLIAAYVAPESDKEALVTELVRLFDGPEQREAQRLATQALGEVGGSIAQMAGLVFGHNGRPRPQENAGRIGDFIRADLLPDASVRPYPRVVCSLPRQPLLAGARCGLLLVD